MGRNHKDLQVALLRIFPGACITCLAKVLEQKHLSMEEDHKTPARFRQDSVVRRHGFEVERCLCQSVRTVQHTNIASRESDEVEVMIVQCSVAWEFGDCGP